MRVLRMLAGSIVVASSLLIPLTCAAQDDPFSPPGTDTVGLVRDEARGRWWISDRGENAVFYIADADLDADPDAEWERYVDGVNPMFGDVNPGPIAMSGTILWLVLEQRDTAHIVSIETSGPRPVKVGPRIEIPAAARRRPPSITGLAWDGDHLWLVTACGLCSTLFKIDPTTGDELFSVFPGCDARGLTFVRNGTGYKGDLWIVAYNGPRKRPLFSRRRIGGSPSRTTSSQEYFRLGERDRHPDEPAVIARHAYKFWVLDRDENLIKPYEARDLS